SATNNKAGDLLGGFTYRLTAKKYQPPPPTPTLYSPAVTPPPDRLDSWKAIAAYLRRDERTVRRWEKTLGLPVRRVPGTRGSSVFAYVEEIESWLKKTQETIPEAMAAPETTTPETVDRPRALERGPAVRWMAAGFAAIVLAVVAWQLMPRASAGPLRFRVTPDAVIAADASATERWRYAFAAGEQAYLPDGLPWSATGDGSTGVVVLLGNRQRPTDKRNLGGLLLSLSGSGELRWQLGLDDQIEIERTTYGPPWMFPNFTSEVQNGSQRIAIAAHHEIWWPGLAVTLDAQGKRTGRFVNAGWIEDVHWMPGNRLLVNGYAEHLGGMLAALDASAMNGHSPAPPGGTFACNGCGTDMPLRYVAFPASELNRV